MHLPTVAADTDCRKGAAIEPNKGHYGGDDTQGTSDSIGLLVCRFGDGIAALYTLPVVAVPGVAWI
jgi:hypothetical protein